MIPSACGEEPLRHVCRPEGQAEDAPTAHRPAFHRRPADPAWFAFARPLSAKSLICQPAVTAGQAQEPGNSPGRQFRRRRKCSSRETGVVRGTRRAAEQGSPPSSCQPASRALAITQNACSSVMYRRHTAVMKFIPWGRAWGGGGGHRNGRGITVNHKPGPGTAAHFPECHGIAEPSHLMQPCPPGCWVEHAEPAGKNARWVSVRGKNGDCPPGCAQGKRYLPSSLQASFWTITAVNWKRNREPTPYFSVGGR